MNESKFTPGPWGAEPTRNLLEDWRTRVTAPNRLVGILVQPRGLKKCQVEANAALIAAAPELYAACKAVLETFDGIRPGAYASAFRRHFDMLTAVLSKADGNQTEEKPKEASQI